MSGMGTEQRAPGREAERMRAGPVFVPVADVYETKEANIVVLELPGVDPEQLAVTVEKRVLTISGRSRSLVPEGYSLTHAEYRDGEYERSFTLSESIDSQSIEAELKDGLLKLKLPKSRPAPAATIKVKAGS